MASNISQKHKAQGILSKIIDLFNEAILILRTSTNEGAQDTIQEYIFGNVPENDPETGAKVEPLKKPKTEQKVQDALNKGGKSTIEIIKGLDDFFISINDKNKTKLISMIKEAWEDLSSVAITVEESKRERLEQIFYQIEILLSKLKNILGSPSTSEEIGDYLSAKRDEFLHKILG